MHVPSIIQQQCKCQIKHLENTFCPFVWIPSNTSSLRCFSFPGWKRMDISLPMFYGKKSNWGHRIGRRDVGGGGYPYQWHVTSLGTANSINLMLRKVVAAFCCSSVTWESCSEQTLALPPPPPSSLSPSLSHSPSFVSLTSCWRSFFFSQDRSQWRRASLLEF